MSEPMKSAFDFLEELKSVADSYKPLIVCDIELRHNIDYKNNRKRISVCIFYDYEDTHKNFSVYCFEGTSKMNMKVLKAKLIEALEEITCKTQKDIAV